MTRDELRTQITDCWPEPELDQHDTRWTETQRGEAWSWTTTFGSSPLAMTSIVGSIPGAGLLGCLILPQDGGLEFAATRPDPLSPESVKLN
jgi:hypothetical protein